MTRMPIRLVVALLATLLLRGIVLAQSAADAGAVVVSMKGTMAKDEQAANNTGWGGISFGFTGDNAGTVRWFGVAHAELFGGNTFDAKSAVFGAHNVPALTVVGPPKLAQKLFALPDGSRVHLEGLVDRESRNFLLDVVQPLQ